MCHPVFQSDVFRIAKIEEEVGHYDDLTSKVKNIMVREDEGPLEMLADLGADCHAKVEVMDPHGQKQDRRQVERGTLYHSSHHRPPLYRNPLQGIISPGTVLSAHSVFHNGIAKDFFSGSFMSLSRFVRVLGMLLQ